MSEFSHFIGVDVSKETLDVCLLHGTQKEFFKIKNNTKSLKSLVAKLKKSFNLNFSTALFCVENTGDYTSPMLFFLAEFNANIWVEMPIKIQKSSGVNRMKTDKVDAFMIANYAKRFQDRFQPWVRPRKQLIALKKLYALREKIVRNINQYASPLKDIGFTADEEVKAYQLKTYQTILEVLKEEKRQVEEKIKQIIEEDQNLKQLFEIVCSVPGVGFVAAISMIINTNEFKNITDPRKYACYCGIAPFEQSSGSSLFKSRVSHLANKNAKKAIHLGAMSVVTCSGELKEYYYRKIAEGKPKMAVLNAVRNKIIHRVFACVRRMEPYKIDYKMAC